MAPAATRIHLPPAEGNATAPDTTGDLGYTGCHPPVTSTGWKFDRPSRVGQEASETPLETRDRPSLSHTTADGGLHMVDITGKTPTARSATATSVIRIRPEVLDAVVAADLPKGDALAAARVAGVMAAKRTAEWIPLCHPLPLDWVQISFARQAPDRLLIAATVKTTAATGVEMEALTAVSATALTLYDMAKSADKGIVIGPTQLETKRGGKSGAYRRPAEGTRR